MKGFTFRARSAAGPAPVGEPVGSGADAASATAGIATPAIPLAARAEDQLVEAVRDNAPGGQPEEGGEVPAAP
ncbi:MAG: hypothetical protein RLZZ08_758, partial [Pseudomonadota bacterium]